MKMADSGCIYGPTGSYKTTAIAHLAQYIAETTGKKTLLFSSDGGGWKSAQEEVDAGMIVPYRCDSATIPLPIIRRISYGYWPENPDETDVSRVNFRPIDWAEYGGIAVEGLTSISTMLMRHLADKAIKTGEEATSKFSIGIRVNGEIVNETFAGNSKGHYGFVQSQLYGMVMNFISLPVKYVLFTAHESKTEDDDRSTIYGPAIAGKKATALVGSWVGDLIHAQDFAVPRMVKAPNPAKPAELIDTEIVDTVCRYYFKKHPDPGTGIMFPAKPRVTHSAVEALEKLYPGGFFIPNATAGFDDYLRNVDRVGQEAGQKSQALQAWREKQDQKLGRGKAVSSKV
jgi:hypothetical protein